jgi:hypothetical protein
MKTALPKQEKIWHCILKMKPMELQLSDFDFELTLETVRQFYLKWCANCYNLPELKE